MNAKQDSKKFKLAVFTIHDIKPLMILNTSKTSPTCFFVSFSCSEAQSSIQPAQVALSHLLARSPIFELAEVHVDFLSICNQHINARCRCKLPVTASVLPSCSMPELSCLPCLNRSDMFLFDSYLYLVFIPLY